MILPSSTYFPHPVLRQALKRVASWYDSFHPSPRGIVILNYHRVGGNSSLELDLPVTTFEEHLQFLATSRPVYPLDAAIPLLTKPDTLPAHDPVVITFDDGTADFADHALPLLVKYGLPATLFVATSYIEDQRPFPYGAKPLSWTALRDALTTGLVTVGSHTHTHALLDRSPSAQEELVVSRDLIRSRLSTNPNHLAYPKGVPPNPHIEAAVKSLYRSASLTTNQPNPYGHTKPHRLSRSPIQRSDGHKYFRLKVAGELGLEGLLREHLNRWRYRNLKR